jgi:RNA polymerase sigma-70 factor (ECF subfamily)
MIDRPPATALSDPNVWLKDHGDYLYGYALRHLRDPGLAEEAVQETLIAAWQGRASYAGDAGERTWLTGILKHKIIDCFRRLRREAGFESFDAAREAEGEDALTAASFVADGHWADPPKSWGDPENTLEQKRFWEALAACLDRLSPPQRAVFSLRELSGLDTEAICKEMDITATNLWVILYRARMALKACLEIGWTGELTAPRSKRK